MGVTSRWINPNAVPLKQDRFSDNGTFSAAKEGKYGYNKVSVGVDTNCVVGKNPDTDEDVEVREEPEPKDPYRPDEGGGGGGGGEKPPHLVVTVLPSQIAVVKPPDRVRYMMGETIDYTGIEVQALLKSGQPWDGFKGGMVPFGELEFPVKKVDGYTVVANDGSQGNYIEIKHVGDWEEALKFLINKAGVDTSPELKFVSAFDREEFYYWKETGDIANVEITVDNENKLQHVLFFNIDRRVGQYFGRTTLYYTNPYFTATYIQRHGNEIILKRWIAPEYLEQTVRTEYVVDVGETEKYYRIGTANIYFDNPNEIPIYTATSDLDCGISQPIRFSTRGVAVCAPETEGESRHRETRFSGGCIALAPRGNAICYITASADGGGMDIIDRWIDGDAGSESEESETVSTGSQFTYDGRTVHYARGSVAMDGAIASYLPDTSGDGAALLQHAGEIAWTMVYGNVSVTDKALPVQWTRPGDAKVLETEFNISVATAVG